MPVASAEVTFITNRSISLASTRVLHKRNGVLDPSLDEEGGSSQGDNSKSARDPSAVGKFFTALNREPDVVRLASDYVVISDPQQLQ